MNLDTARSLSALTTDFYQRVSPSFSATRQHAWPGWRKVCEVLGLKRDMPVCLFDLACGNLRFEHYLAKEGIPCETWAIDSCDELVRLGEDGLTASSFHYRHHDIAELLFRNNLQTAIRDIPPVDLAVSFGFMHHLPLPDQRVQTLRALLECLRPGGCAVVSLWQFERDERIMAKARPVVDGGPGDYLLGWQDERDVWRYCHSFSEDEITWLAAACDDLATEVTRFSADGKRGDLNRYLVLKKLN